MTDQTTAEPVRLWPGLAIVALQWATRFALPAVVPDTMGIAIIGGMAGGLLILLWWLLFSGAPWAERLGAIALTIAALFTTSRLLDESIATGMMGMMFAMHVTPFLSLALVGWAVVTRGWSGWPRYASLGVAIAAACGMWTLLRTDGITGEGSSQLAWRWSKTAEVRLLAAQPLPAPTPAPAPAAPAAPAPVTPEPPKAAPAKPAPEPAVRPADWPGFRGPNRDGIVRGTRIRTDWKTSPPVELWRRAVGPGWSSFAVRGELFYTQEQRGEEEIVACYRLSDGRPVWTHRDAARFWESNGGAGPRATPTLAGARLYTFGASGIVNALDAASGALLWSRNAAADTEVPVPGWGFASSPLVTKDAVIVAAAGRLAAYDMATGEPRWFGPANREGYSSPHLMRLGGVEQIVLMNGAGAAGLDLATGTPLWEYPWPGSPILQPAVAAGGDLLIATSSTSGGSGLRRLAVSHEPGAGWTTAARWTSAGLKPYFNDFVVHHGHAFGFDGRILACIGLEDGSRKWKGGRYGNGQFLLLAGQDLLLVLSEDGELALVNATPGGFTELARVQAIEGKTWNHPALAGDTLLVRNGQEMAAFRLAQAAGSLR